MDDNNKTLNHHPSVIAELDELESLLLLMLGSATSEMAVESRQHLIALAYRLVTVALDKAHGGTTA